MCPFIHTCEHNKDCAKERICLNPHYWADYWKKKKYIPPLTSLKKKMQILICCYCEREIYTKKNLTIEHLVPLSKNGNNSAENKRTCCRTCNGDRGNLDYLEWIAKMRLDLATEVRSDRANLLEIRIKNALLCLKYVLHMGGKLFKK